MTKQNILRIITIVIITTILTACSYGIPLSRPDSKNIALEDVRSDMSKNNQRIKMVNEPGMIHIQRHTKEYSISMVLDASDENIYFMMDLPPDQMEAPAEVMPEEKPVEEPVEPVAEEAPTDETKPEVVSPEANKEPVDETRASKYVLYAQTYFLEKKYARALEEINRAIEYSPNSAVAHSLKGSIYFKLNEKELARGSWKRALELDESLDNVKLMLDKLDKSQGKNKQG